MKIRIDGNITAYYVQTLSMIFFPGESFSEKNEFSGEPSLYVRVTEEADGVLAYAEMSFGGRTCHGSGRRFHADSGSYTAKLAVGDAVFEAGCSLCGFESPWGTMIGVRPVKNAAQFLLSGLSAAEAADKLTDTFHLRRDKAELLCRIAKKEFAVPNHNKSGKVCSVYISIPFCPSRCAYCSFVSFTSEKLLSLIPEYVDALCEDIRKMCDTIKKLGMRVVSVYIGGGTPTVLNPSQLKAVLEAVAAGIDVNALEEYTLEGGRPDTITAEKLAIAASLGVTRLSVNPQTIWDETLQKIGRNHTYADFLRAYEIAEKSGIPVINTDLIAGLPGEDGAMFAASVDAMIRLKPANITVHTFCVKRSARLRTDVIGTADYGEIYNAFSPETGFGIDHAHRVTDAAGYEPYYLYRQKNAAGNLENTGYAIPGTEGMYNIYMMEELHSIFAAGAGAVSKFVNPNGDLKSPIKRIFTPKYPYEYLHGVPQGEHTCDRDEEALLFFDAL